MRAMDVRLVETKTHGRLLVRAADPRQLLVGFHGYAQNAEEMMSELEQIPGSESWTLVSIQGLHRFYRSRSEVVVSSWMTRLDRERAISDNLEYVRRAIETFAEAQKIVFAGFSQGAAMAYRAASTIRCSGVVVLGGDLPPDVDGSSLPRVLIGRGVRDEWFTAAKVAADQARLSSSELIELDAGHEWTAEFRSKAGELLLSV